VRRFNRGGDKLRLVYAVIRLVDGYRFAAGVVGPEFLFKNVGVVFDY
jgi:hypothetical protein